MIDALDYIKQKTLLQSKRSFLSFTQIFSLTETLEVQNIVNPLSANPTKWSNTPKQFVGNDRRIP